MSEAGAIPRSAAVLQAIAPGVLWPEEALDLADPFVLVNAELDRATTAASGRVSRRDVATMLLTSRPTGIVLRAFPTPRRTRLDLVVFVSGFAVSDVAASPVAIARKAAAVLPGRRRRRAFGAREQLIDATDRISPALYDSILAGKRSRREKG